MKKRLQWYLGLLDNLVCAKRKATLQILRMYYSLERIEYYKGLDILVEAGKADEEC